MRTCAITHGRHNTPEYDCWKQMRARCLNERSQSFKNYGARGIHIAERWSTFEQFFTDMGPRPSPEHSLDRIDNDGQYSPDNCRWATIDVQSRNKRANRPLTYDGRTMLLSDWAKAQGITLTTLIARLRYGWSVERALTEPVH